MFLEYRVWCHPERGSSDLEDGSDYYYPFATYAEALAFSQRTEGAEAPLAPIRQLEYIAKDNPGEDRHVKKVRIAEWPVEFLAVLDAHRIQFLIFWYRMRLPIGGIFFAVWKIRNESGGSPTTRHKPAPSVRTARQSVGHSCEDDGRFPEFHPGCESQNRRRPA